MLFRKKLKRKTYNDISSLGVLLYVFYYSKDN